MWYTDIHGQNYPSMERKRERERDHTLKGEAGTVKPEDVHRVEFKMVNRGLLEGKV